MKEIRTNVVCCVSECEDAELREKLESEYAQYEGLRRLQVEAVRAAARAAAQAAKLQAEVQLSQLDFLITAGEAFDLVNIEPVWLTRRDRSGQILLECVLTERDVQNAMRAQAKQIKRQTSELNGNDDDDDEIDLFTTK